MKAKLFFKMLCHCLLVLAILPTRGAAQAAAQAAPPAGANSVCAGQPACYETGTFASAITDFRLSAVSGLKVIDTTIRFVNKTNQPLILGYVDGSAMAIDDEGNRYVINGYAGPNAIRGIGKIVGNNIDPKFVLQPAGVGDSMYELIWRQGGTEGVSFELDMTVRQITPLERNQFSVGGEFPLQFRGLAAGMFSTGAAAAAGQAPAAAGTASMAGAAGTSAAGEPCTTDGSGAAPGAGSSVSTLADTANSVTGQKMPAGASNAISTASSSISSLGSLFGHKKAAATAAAPAAAAPCVPAAGPGTANGASPFSGIADAMPGVAGSAPATTATAAGSTATTVNSAPQMVKGSAAAGTTRVPGGQPMLRTTAPTNAAPQVVNPAAAAAGTTGVPAGHPLVRTATPAAPQGVNPPAAAAAARVQVARPQAAPAQAAPVQAANTATTTAATAKTAPAAKPPAKKPATTAASGTTGQK